MPAPQLAPHVKSVVVALDPASFQAVMAQMQGNAPYELQKLVANTYHNQKEKDGKKKRTLNCYMAFRCYLAPIFDKFQQKEISSMLKALWAAEEAKPKWTVLAKAYSIIRDEVGGDNAPMTVFLNLACPHIGIVSRDDYLGTFGWELVQDNNGNQLIRRFTPPANTFPANFFTTMMSAQDVVVFVRTQGYGVVANAPTMSSNSANMLFTMTAPSSQVAQPASQMVLPAAQVVHPTAQAVHPTAQAVQNAPPMVHPAAQIVQQAPQVAHPTPQVAQNAPQMAQAVPQTTQLRPMDVATILPDNMNAAVNKAQKAKGDIFNMIASGVSVESLDETLIQILSGDSMAEECTMERRDHSDPFLFSGSFNSQPTLSNGNRPYYAATNSHSGVVAEENAVDTDARLTYGQNAFRELATELWQSESAYPYSDQFIPGNNYTKMNDHAVIPEFVSFDMNDLSNWPELQQAAHPDSQSA